MMQRNNRIDIEYEGRKAFVHGLDKLDCPYIDPKKAEQWEQGYQYEQHLTTNPLEIN